MSLRRMGRFSEGGSSGSADGKKCEEAFDWNGNIVLEEAAEVEEPPPLPPPKALAMPEDPPVPAEASPVEVAPLLEDEVIAVAEPEDPPVPAEAGPVEVSRGQEVMQRIAEAPARLGIPAYRALEDEFIAVAKPEELRSEDREIWEAVRGTGFGLCGRCHWMNGCDKCDEDKAWDFACRSTLWHTADEALRPSAKPKGRPKKRAA